MPTPMENLIDFIQRRRARMGLGHNALARACGLDPGTLANLMVGRIKNAPSLGTLHKLASGLQVDVQLLIRIAGGYSVDIAALADDPDGWDGKAAAIPADPPEVDCPHPLTDDEREVLERARTVGLHWSIARQADLLDIPPSDRIWMFRELESVLHAIAIHQRLAALG